MISQQLDIIIANITPIQKSNPEKETEIHIFSTDPIFVLLNENEPIIMLEKKSSIYRQIDFTFKSAGITPAKVYSCPEIHSMVGLLQSNTGIGFLSSRVASEYHVHFYLFLQNNLFLVYICQEVPLYCPVLLLYPEYLTFCYILGVV